jgi:hypothetical protein
MALLCVLATSLLSCSNLALELTCLGGSYPPPAFPIEELLLDESVFPEGWQARERTFDPRQRLPAEQIALSFYLHWCPDASLGAGHQLYRFFDGPRCAALGYQKEIPGWFAPTQAWGPWEVPAELPYQSPVADQFRFNCSTHQRSGAQTCLGVGQYEDYVIRFQTSIDREHPECMSFTDLERILKAIDERMAFYLEKDME